MLRKIARLTLAFLIVSSAVLGGIGGGVGEAEAAIFQDCDATDSLTSAFLKGLFSPNADGECRFNPDDPPADTRANLDALALQQQTTSEQYQTAMQNRLQDTRGQAMMIAKQSIINSLNEGDNATVAIAEAKAATDDYYATIQTNMLNRMETDLQGIRYMQNVSEANGASWVKVYARDEWEPMDQWQQINHTLANGSSHDTIGSRHVPSEYTGGYYAQPAFTQTDQHGTSSLPYINRSTEAMGDDASYLYDTTYRYTNSTSSSITVYDFKGWHDAWAQTVEQNNWVDSNTDAVATEVYNAYNAGELNTSDLYDPFTIGVNSATEFNSTGSYSFAAFQMASLGYSGNLTASHTIEVKNSTGDTVETLDGTLYYTADDITTLENNVSYTLADYNGSFVMAVQPRDTNKSAYVQDLNEISGATSFEITSTVNTQTGEPVSNTTIEKRVYETTDVSNLEEQINDLTQLYEEQQEAQQQGGGGGFGINLGGTQFATVGVIVALLVVALFRP